MKDKKDKFVIDEKGYVNPAMQKKYDEIMRRKKLQEQQKKGK